LFFLQSLVRSGERCFVVTESSDYCNMFLSSEIFKYLSDQRCFHVFDHALKETFLALCMTLQPFLKALKLLKLKRKSLGSLSQVWLPAAASRPRGCGGVDGAG